MRRKGDSHTINIFGEEPKKRPLPPGGAYTKLVGMAKIEGAQGRIAWMRKIGIAYLVVDREPDNPYDTNAIRLLLPGDGLPEERVVGYLKATLAAHLAPILDAGKHRVRCRVEMVTGGEPGKEYLGINVALFCTDGFDLLSHHPGYTGGE